MNPKRISSVEPDPAELLNPFSDPRTIPGGWDVSAFHVTSHEHNTRSQVAAMPNARRDGMPSRYENA